MKIENFLNKKVCFFNLEFKTKNDALDYLSSELVKKGFGKDKNKILSAALKREEEFSTGIGDEIAVPHIRIPEMESSVLLFAKVKPIGWDSMDGKDIKYIFFIALNDKDNVHIEILSELSKNLMSSDFLNQLEGISSFPQLVDLFKNNEVKEEISEEYEGNYDIVGITACPTGIAHTYMAAEQLKKKALEMGLKIKIETQGTEGARNILTDNEIKNARGVILAIDRAVDLDRFTNHENVIETTTRKVIKDPEGEMNNILQKKGTKLKGSLGSNESSGENLSGFNFDKFGKRVLKALLTGVSYMLPFVIFGGIMIAVAFIIDIPNAGDPSFGSVNHVAYWFKTLGDISFSLMVPMLGAYIAYALIGKVGLLPGFVTGFISSGSFLFKEGVGWFGTPASSSGFFGAIGGGILSAVIIILIMKYIVSKIPKSLNGIMQILVVPFLGTLVIATLFWIINIPLLYLNYGFSLFLGIFQGDNNLAIILGLIVGIMMATDMGGPINKAAYVFAVATLEETAGSGTFVMASVMAAGMVPPLGIAISTAFNKKLWTKEERDAGLANWIMGFSFITEGAIPFAAKNPKIIIPSSMIGASIAGMLSAVFGITLAAPHGGIFVFALVKSTLFEEAGLSIGLGIVFYLISIIIGSIVTAIMINIFTKLFNKNKDQKNQVIKLENKSWFSMFKNKSKSNSLESKSNSLESKSNSFKSQWVIRNNLCFIQ
ncbi:MAG: PTS fructose transporter subunit IIABC [Metamycoplasmataceae bacterium]